MGRSQGSIFAEFEGDRWFERNRAHIAAFDPERDLPLKLLQLYGLRPKSVLEVGAANGFRLAAITRMLDTRVVALEPSGEARADGMTRFPEVEFVAGHASAIPLRESFDLVIVNFVLHWVDRGVLATSAAEIDRVVADGGCLIVGDFFPSNRFKVRYHHLPEEEVYTYKQDYADLFLSTGSYLPVSLLTARHGDGVMTPDVAEEERIGTWLLRKTLGANYLEMRLPR